MKNEPNIKIFVTHFNKPGFIYEDTMYIPIQAGKKNSKIDLGIQGDDTGDNISDKNCQYGELTTQYWVWKNYDLIDVDYVGFCHYRRYMTYCHKPSLLNTFLNKGKVTNESKGLYNKVRMYEEGNYQTVFDVNLIKENGINTIDYIKKNHRDIYLPKREIYYYAGKILAHLGLPIKDSNTNNWMRSQSEDFDKKSKELFKSMYPEYREAYNKLKQQKNEKLLIGNHRHMFIMSKENFYNYSKRLFDYLFEIEKKYIHYVDLKKEYQEGLRFIGIFAEIFINYRIAYQIQHGQEVSYDANLIFLNKI